MEQRKGLFLVFEGPDRSGKTTQAILLKDFLITQGFKVILTREPGGTDVGEEIRKILLNPQKKISPLTELFLYEASRSQHIFEKIKPALDEGKVVICDRFTIATLAYQGYGRKIDLNTIKLLNDIATSRIMPDFIIGFKIPYDEYLRRKRTTSDRIELEDEDFIKRVNDGYDKLYREYNNILIVDSSKSIDEIHKEIRLEVLNRINGI